MKFPEARIGLCYCKECKKIYGVRFEQYENEWKATWAFPIKKEESIKRENYDKTQLKGLIRWDEDYPGCPYCHSKGFVICDNCGGLNCNTNPNDKIFTCGWCGITGELTNYTGDGFNAGGDR